MNNKEKLTEETINLLNKVNTQPLYEMADLSPKRTSLNVIIWLEQQGFKTF